MKKATVKRPRASKPRDSGARRRCFRFRPIVILPSQASATPGTLTRGRQTPILNLWPTCAGLPTKNTANSTEAPQCDR